MRAFVSFGTTGGINRSGTVSQTDGRAGFCYLLPCSISTTPRSIWSAAWTPSASRSRAHAPGAIPLARSLVGESAGTPPIRGNGGAQRRGHVKLRPGTPPVWKKSSSDGRSRHGRSPHPCLHSQHSWATGRGLALLQIALGGHRHCRATGRGKSSGQPRHALGFGDEPERETKAPLTIQIEGEEDLLEGRNDADLRHMSTSAQLFE